MTTASAEAAAGGPLPAAVAADRVRRRGRRPGTSGWVFAAPAALLFAVFFAYPLLASLWQSLHSTDGGVQTWVGLGQYHRLLADPLVATSLVNTGILLVVQVPVMIGTALVVAYVLNQSWLRWRTTLRAAYFLPAVTTLVAYSLVFRVLLTTDGGLVNQALGLVGAGPVDWLNSAGWAKVALIASITWRWTGYNMVILLAGLPSSPRELSAAAAIDGAGRWTTFRRIVVPQLRPVLLFTTVTSSIGTLQLFDEAFVLTGGGPSNATLTPVLYLYKVGFRQFDFGYASAIAWMLVLLIAVLSVVQFRLMRER
jgi:lactose/L-arabinose transport system permease protein